MEKVGLFWKKPYFFFERLKLDNLKKSRAFSKKPLLFPEKALLFRLKLRTQEFNIRNVFIFRRKVLKGAILRSKLRKSDPSLCPFGFSIYLANIFAQYSLLRQQKNSPVKTIFRAKNRSAQHEKNMNVQLSFTVSGIPFYIFFDVVYEGKKTFLHKSCTYRDYSQLRNNKILCAKAVQYREI